MRTADPTMNGMTMGGGYRRVHPQVGGIPGLAIRAGRLLELWGRRASRPMTPPEVELHLQAERRARTAIAAREATVTRAWYQNIR
jgi:hypothetical protein